MRYLLLSLILVSASAWGETWKCVADAAAGLTYESGSWVPETYSGGMKYLVKQTDKGPMMYRSGDDGPMTNPCAQDDSIILCNTPFVHFVINKKFAPLRASNYGFRP